jgi:hypothetical protein
MSFPQYKADRIWQLPPLILHPFSDNRSPQKLVQSSRAHLMMQGVIPNDEFSVEQLDEMVLDGRFCEIRMLFYVGKDVLRWVEQCAELVDREADLQAAGIAPQSFIAMLAEDTPVAVKKKLSTWGVQDYHSIFTRAVGFNGVWAAPPGREELANEFIRNYYIYADGMYSCWLNARPFARIRSADFEFELYASGEYSRMLARQWSEQE